MGGVYVCVCGGGGVLGVGEGEKGEGVVAARRTRVPTTVQSSIFPPVFLHTETD